MCGRINIDEPLAQMVGKRLGIPFYSESNQDLRPTQQVAALVMLTNVLQQQNAIWGIRPQWARRLLINAKAETVAEKRTFADAFAQRRCLVPCSGWYEWRDEGGPHKAKYLFSHADDQPLYMAALWYPALPGEDLPRIVTLTTTPNPQCAEYHQRMPALILPDAIDGWFGARPELLPPLLAPVDSELIRVSAG